MPAPSHADSLNELAPCKIIFGLLSKQISACFQNIFNLAWWRAIGLFHRKAFAYLIKKYQL
jgi:hypothetical protein